MDKFSYALGVSVGQQLLGSGVTRLDYDDFVNGLDTALQEKEPVLSGEEGNKVLSDYFENVKREQLKKNKEENALNKKKGEEYLKENKSKDGVEVTRSGLQYKVITKSTDPNKKTPLSYSRVKCHYEGRFIDGNVFDSSYKRNEPAVFGLNQVIPGWTEGLQLMGVGDKYEFTLPSELAYGDVGVPGHIPGNSVLIFTVELLDVL